LGVAFGLLFAPLALPLAIWARRLRINSTVEKDFFPYVIVPVFLTLSLALLLVILGI
jgi:hypothetical protein